MKGIFLDDERVPSDVTWVSYPDSIEWNIVRTHNEFVDVIYALEDDDISSYVFSFDHDIQSFGDDGNEVTGYDCLKFLVNYCFSSSIDVPCDVIFHTQNPVGKKNMMHYHENALKATVVTWGSNHGY